MQRQGAHLVRLAPAAAMEQVHTGLGLLRAGRVDEACRTLQALVALEPNFPPGREVFACALQMRGDLQGAEREMRAAAALDPADPAFPAGLGEILRLQDRPKDAELAYRSALALDGGHEPAVQGLARLLLAQGRAAEADGLLGPLTDRRSAGPALLDLHVAALRGLNRQAEAAPLASRYVASAPTSSAAEAALAAVLEELGDTDGAEAAARRSVRKAPEDPDALMRLGRLLQAKGALDEAEKCLRDAVARRPNDGDIHMALADLLWMRTASLDATLAPLTASLERVRTVSLLTLKAKLMGRLGAGEAAYAMVAQAATHDPAAAGLQAAAASAAAAANRGRDMLSHAEALHRLRPADPGSWKLLAEACVRVGEFARALPLLDGYLREAPYDQQALAVRALAWRCLGDPRYQELYDYPRMVRTFFIEPPPGWATRADYLAALAEALRALHRFDAPPLDQSLRGGTQTSHNLALSRDPAIGAFFTAIDAPVRRYVEDLGPGSDPLRARRAPGYRVSGAWSVRLRPNGFHVSHVHPDGWLSSAFYVEAPEAVSRDDRQGWLQFGEPGVVMAGQPAADHFVRPEPGMLVLFPSYMLHGTRPFGGDSVRLTMAFDLVPAEAPGA